MYFEERIRYKENIAYLTWRNDLIIIVVKGKLRIDPTTAST